MYRLVYVSAATRPFSKEDLIDLMTQAQARNARRGITGMLLYKDGDFMQLLEGERAVVEGLFARIETDPRHRGAMVLMGQECSSRLFPDWSMAFRDLSDPELHSKPGYSELLNRPLRDHAFSDHPDEAVQLLGVFAQAGLR